MLDEKIEKSVKALKLAAEMSKTYYGLPMILCYSGGKDSDVLLHLAVQSLNADDFEVLNSHTSVDAPETAICASCQSIIAMLFYNDISISRDLMRMYFC